MKIRNIFHSIPGFRSGNYVNMTFAGVYYVLVCIIGFPNIPMIIMGLVFPSIIFSGYKLIKTLNFKNATPLLILTLIFAVSAPFGIKGLKTKLQKNAAEQKAEEEKDVSINKRKLESEKEYEEKLMNQENLEAEENPEMNQYFAPARVKKVIDSDTIVITREDNSSEERVKLLGISPPERPKNPDEDSTKADTTLSYVRNVLAGRKVFLEVDSTKEDSDGNKLYYIWLEQPKTKKVTKDQVSNMMFNAQLVLNGYARSVFYPPNIKYSDWFDDLENEARDKGWGIWAEDVPDYTNKSKEKKEKSDKNGRKESAPSEGNQTESPEESTGITESYGPSEPEHEGDMAPSLAPS